MIQEIASMLVFGKPLFLWAGLITMICLISTFVSGLLVMRGKTKFKYHKMLAYTTLAVGTVHGILVISVFFVAF